MNLKKNTMLLIEIKSNLPILKKKTQTISSKTFHTKCVHFNLLQKMFQTVWNAVFNSIYFHFR